MTSESSPRLDIVIPVYNEGANILQTLGSLLRTIRTPYRVLICYDRDDDDTLTAIEHNREALAGMNIEFVPNRGRGAHSAVLTGFATSKAPLILVLTADDDYNANIIDSLVAKALAGFDIVCPSRFAPGGSMTGCPFLKACVTVVGNLSLYHLANLPTRDATNGFRLFSRRVLDQIVIESDRGFCYSVELLVKCHRLGWPIAEMAAQWHERVRGKSRFHVVQWLPAYARWYFYALATTHLRRPGRTVRRKQAAQPSGRIWVMVSDWPKIRSRRTTQISPWLSIIEREVEFARETEVQLYHAVGQYDYIAIVAALPDGRLPIVRQYRPALERFTWELPAGLLDTDEDAPTCCRRELREETGFTARAVHELGCYAPCTSRMSNKLYSFFVETEPTAATNPSDPGIELKLVSLKQLAALIKEGEFVLQLHIGAVLLAGLQGFIDLGAFQRISK